MDTDETPIDEWLRNTKGREYAVIRGPGGGTVFRKGTETVDEARARRVVEQEAKRRRQGEPSEAPKPGRPKGKGRKPDPKPGPSSTASKPAKPKPTRDQLAAAATVPLSVFGAFVGYQVLGCEFCANSMRQNAGAAAEDLAKSTNPYMVGLLTWWWSLANAFAGGDGLVKFIGPPVVHHLAPAPMAEFVSPFMGVPPRAPKPTRPAHEHGPARAETVGPLPGEGSPPGSPPGNAPPAPGGNGGPPVVLTPEQAAALAQERARLDAEAARLMAIRDIGMRQAAAAGAVQGMQNIPSYRADVAPGTPTAPPVPPGADPMGSPLPPEAGG